MFFFCWGGGVGWDRLLVKIQAHVWLMILLRQYHLQVSLIQRQYAVKAQTSLAPLSRFRGSHVTTAHAHQCCRFQSYVKTGPSRMKLTLKLTKREPHCWDLWQRTTWSRRVTSDFNSVLQCCVLESVHKGYNVSISPFFHYRIITIITP